MEFCGRVDERAKLAEGEGAGVQRAAVGLGSGRRVVKNDIVVKGGGGRAKGERYRRVGKGRVGEDAAGRDAVGSQFEVKVRGESNNCTGYICSRWIEVEIAGGKACQHTPQKSKNFGTTMI